MKSQTMLKIIHLLTLYVPFLIIRMINLIRRKRFQNGIHLLSLGKTLLYKKDNIGKKFRKYFIVMVVGINRKYIQVHYEQDIDEFSEYCIAKYVLLNEIHPLSFKDKKSLSNEWLSPNQRFEIFAKLYMKGEID